MYGGIVSGLSGLQHTSVQCPFNTSRLYEHLLSLQEVCHEGHVVLAVFLRPLGQLAHHGGVARGCCEEQQATVILGMMQALLGQAKLALTDRKLCQLLPFLLRL